MFGYISLGLVLVALIILAVNIAKGLVRGLQKSVGSLVAVIFSAVGAFLMTAMLCKPYSVITIKISDVLHSLLSGSAAAELFAISEVDGAVSIYAAVLIAPLFFAVAFIALSIVFGIICGIIFKKIPQWLEKKSTASRLGGLGVSIVCGVLVAVMVLTPFVGTINVIASSGIEDSLPEGTAEIIGDAKNDSALGLLESIGCGALYDQLASTKIDGEKTYLKDELKTVAAITSKVSVLKGSIADYNEEQIKALHDVIDVLDSSPVLKSALAGLLSTAAGKWAEGETFMGVGKPDAGTLFAPVMDKMVDVFKTSDETTLIADMTTMVDVFGIICESGILGRDVDYVKVMTEMGEKDIIAKLVKTVNANKRMAPLADEITALSLRAIAQVFDLPENAEENYNNLMNDVALAVGEGSTLAAEEKAEFLSKKMETVLDDYGVEVDVEAAKNIAVGIVEDLGGVESVSAEDVEEFFIIYALAAENNKQSGTTSKVYGEAKLMNATASAKGVLLNGTEKQEGTKEFDVVIDADGKLIVNGRMLKNYTAADYKNSAAYKSGAEGKNFGGGATLSSPKTMESSRVTVESIVSSIGTYADCEDIDAEAEAIQSLVVDAVNSFTGVEMNKDAVSQLVTGAGQLLDGVSKTTSIGQQAAGQLLTGILQSNKVSGSLGVSVSDATKVAESINEKASKDDFDYSHATNAISGTLNAITSASDETKTSEEKMDATKGMIENITPDSAEVLGTMATPEMMKNYGVPEKNAEAVSNAVSTMFDHMGDYNVSDTNDAEQFEKEAEAIDKMFQLVMNSYNAGAVNLFAAGGEEGKISVSAGELVSLAMESEVISKTVDEIIYGDGTYNGNPLNIPELTESDSKQVRDAINSYYAANGSTPEVGRKLRAIAGFLNIDVNF